MDVDEPDVVDQESKSVAMEEEEVEQQDDDGWGEEEETQPVTLQRMASTESNWSQASDGWGDGGDGGDWDAMAEDDEALADRIPDELKKRVLADLDELRLLSRFTVHSPNFGGGTRIQLRAGFRVDSLGLDAEQARAWTLDQKKLVVVHLELPPHYFNIQSMSQIHVKVGQALKIDDEIVGFGLSWTLEHHIKQELLPSLGTALISADYSYESVRDIMEATGASFLVAHSALLKCKHNAAVAMSMLTDEAAQTTLKRQISHTQEAEEKKEVAPEALQLADQFNTTVDVAALAMDLEGSVEKATTFLSISGAIDRLEEMIAIRGSPQKKVSLAEQRSIEEVIEKHNFLVRMMVFAEEKLKHCHQFCIICGNKLEYIGLKPAVCDGALCKMGFEDFGLGFDLSGMVVENAEVTDLLITLAVAACNNQRMNFVRPVGVRAMSRHGKELSFLVKGTEESKEPQLDYARLSSCLNACPSVSEMQSMAQQGVLDESLKKLDPLLLPLLRWIMTSTRAHLRRLEQSEMLSDFNTPHQFVLLSSPPEKEVRFQQLKNAAALKRGKNKGAIYAFHGSATSNWHSIMRTGLKNMSGTKYQLNGAAYGSGIYMAVQSGTSLGYSANVTGWSKSLFGPTAQLLALCEVVNDPSLKPPSPYYVVPEEDWVTTRFLFVYPQGSSCNVTIEMIEKKVPQYKSAVQLDS